MTTMEKMNKVDANLSYMIRNLAEPREARRRIVMSTALSILPYGATVWAGERW